MARLLLQLAHRQYVLEYTRDPMRIVKSITIRQRNLAGEAHTTPHPHFKSPRTPPRPNSQLRHHSEPYTPPVHRFPLLTGVHTTRRREFVGSALCRGEHINHNSRFPIIHSPPSVRRRCLKTVNDAKKQSHKIGLAMRSCGY